jgi:ferredoxin-NADP reductase
LVVSKRTDAATDVVLLELRATDGSDLPHWEAGAHIDVVRPDGTARQYSLTGNPADTDRWQVAVLLEQDGRGGSRWVHQDLVEGSTVLVRGPRNHFRLDQAPAYHFVAGGIGITPLVAMAHQATAAGTPWTLTYCGRDRSRMALLDDVIALGGDRTQVYPSAETGRADLKSLIAELTERTRVYCCGPAAVIEAVEEACAALDVPPPRSEKFTPPEIDTSNDTSFEVELASDGRVLEVPAGCSILDVLKGSGVNVIASCEEGSCGTCETGVLFGEPEHRDNVLTSEEQAENDFMMVCISRSRSPRLVLDL